MLSVCHRIWWHNRQKRGALQLGKLPLLWGTAVAGSNGLEKLPQAVLAELVLIHQLLVDAPSAFLQGKAITRGAASTFQQHAVYAKLLTLRCTFVFEELPGAAGAAHGG